ncbi:MAG: preprotein translocase subunit SecG [Candidatus Limnocylindrales bacterium]
MDTFLAIGQIVVSLGLVTFILLQARGAGLSSAFGGDSSVYRSRRGIEKTLFRFTIVLAVVFVIFSLISFRLSATA